MIKNILRSIIIEFISDVNYNKIKISSCLVLTHICHINIESNYSHYNRNKQFSTNFYDYVKTFDVYLHFDNNKGTV